MAAIELALGIVALGFPVFPCGANKRPAIGEGERWGHGFHDATTDPDTVRAMFSRENAVLVGVPTGPRSGIVVVDVDYRNGGGEWEATNLAGLTAHPTRQHST